MVYLFIFFKEWAQTFVLYLAYCQILELNIKIAVGTHKLIQISQLVWDYS